MNLWKRSDGVVPESQPLVQLLQESSVELVDGVDVGEKERHEALWHGVFFDHCATEPLRQTTHYYTEDTEDVQHFLKKNKSRKMSTDSWKILVINTKLNSCVLCSEYF